MGTTKVEIIDKSKTDVNIIDIDSTFLCHNVLAVIQ